MRITGLEPTKVWASTETPEFVVNTLAFDEDGKGYIFVKGKASTSIVAGDVCQIEENGEASEVTVTTTAPGTGQGLPVGVGVSTIAAGGWGWLQVYGVIAAINVATSAAAHTILNSTATAGRIDDDATAGAEKIDGVTTTAAESSNSAAGILVFPRVGLTGA